MPRISQIGFGYLGKAYGKVFEDSIIYDPYSKEIPYNRIATKEQVNKTDIALIAVPTDLLPDGSLDTSIVEETIDWLETPYILIKSALMPGTVDRLVKKTGKNIAVSCELIGMGNYYIDPHEFPDPKDPRKHKTLIIGGEIETATKCAEILWDKMQPNIKIHLVSALEAEITKLVENSYPALKVSFINALYELTQKSDASFIKVHQAWSSDSRVDGFHMRTVSFKRGWASHCWSKDIPALARYSEQVGANTMKKLFDTVIEINNEHLKENG